MMILLPCHKVIKKLYTYCFLFSSNQVLFLTNSLSFSLLRSKRNISGVTGMKTEEWSGNNVNDDDIFLSFFWLPLFFSHSFLPSLSSLFFNPWFHRRQDVDDDEKEKAQKYTTTTTTITREKNKTAAEQQTCMHTVLALTEVGKHTTPY